MKKKCFNIVWLIAVLLSFTACNDFLDIQPVGKVMPKTGQEFRDLLTEAYSAIPSDRGMATFRSDELTMEGEQNQESLNSYLDIWCWNDIAPDQTTLSFGWQRYYYVNYIANSVIENKDNITEATQAERNQLAGEAYMLRAYMHFILVNLYADPYTHCNPATTKGIPLKLNSDVREVLSRSTVEEVYASILSDIDEAEKLLNVETWPEGETYRFNILSANAFRARVYLYMGDWANAYDYAIDVVNRHGELEELTTSTTLPNHYQSVEAILSMERLFIASSLGVGYVNPELMSLYRSGDMRRNKFYRQISSSATEALKTGTNEFRCTFRSAEFYLTAAEAALELNDMDNARHYLTELMKKRYLSAIYPTYEAEILSMTQDELREEIYNERFRELAYEGHRWFDLRRTTRQELTKTYKGETYVLQKDDSRYTLRIPADAIEANPGLEEENRE